MNSILKPLIIALTVCLLCGCLSGGGARANKAPLSAMQRSAMQTKEMPGDFDTAYKATISVLQDHGWQIDTIDRDSGIIQASSIRYQDVIGPNDDFRAHEKSIQKVRTQMAKFKGGKNVSPALWNRWERLTVLIEAWGTKTVRERITIVKCGALPGGRHYYPNPKLFGHKAHEVQEGGQEQSIIVETPQAYQLLFQKIQKAIFVRQGLTGK